MITIYVLMLLFTDGYMEGAAHVHDFRTMAQCQKYGPQLAAQYTSYGHPATFTCTKQKRVKVLPKPEVHSIQTLPAG